MVKHMFLVITYPAHHIIGHMHKGTVNLLSFTHSYVVKQYGGFFPFFFLRDFKVDRENMFIVREVWHQTLSKISEIIT